MATSNPFADATTPQSPQANPANPFLDSSTAQQAPPPGMMSRAANVGTDLAKGVGEGALQTVNTVSGLINKIPGIGETLAPSQGVSSADAIATPTNTTQKVGVGAESIAEALLGDEALKGLSLGDKLLKVGKVSEVYEKASPFVRAAIERGLNAARAGAVAGGETFGKSGDVGQAAKAAGEGAVAAPVLETALPVVGKAVGKVASTAGDIWSTVTGKAIQDNLQTGLRSVLGDVADSASVKPSASSVRDSAGSLADAVTKKAKGLFQTIDDATDGELTNVQNKIRNVDMKLRGIAGTDDAAEEKLLNQKSNLEESLDNVMELAKQNGVDPSVADNARASWKQASALNDLDTAVKGSTFGDSIHAPEVVNPKKLVDRLQKLDDNGRLQEAIGEDGADTLIGHAYDALKSSNRRTTAGKVAKIVGIGGGVLGGGDALLGALHGK